MRRSTSSPKKARSSFGLRLFFLGGRGGPRKGIKDKRKSRNLGSAQSMRSSCGCSAFVATLVFLWTSYFYFYVCVSVYFYLLFLAFVCVSYF